MPIMQTWEEPEWRKQNERLARYLYAAWTAYRLRLTIAHVEKTYARGENDIGDLWYFLAYITNNLMTGEGIEPLETVGDKFDAKRKPS